VVPRAILDTVVKRKIPSLSWELNCNIELSLAATIDLVLGIRLKDMYKVPMFN
jgi:hypothetical protein